MSEWFNQLLVCPDCGHPLKFSGERITCNKCEFGSTIKNIPDLRPQRPNSVNFSFDRLSADSPIDQLNHIEIRPPPISYDGPQAIRDSRELLSLLEQNLEDNGHVLDLGCGPKDQKIPIEFLGLRYVGADYSNPAADLLIDAHAIPFRNDSFDCVFSYAVLEHLHNPFVAIREIERVLKPGGIYIGTVSQGEPFHQSFFHFTPWGMLSFISTTEHLKIERLWHSMDTLESLSRIGRYPRVIRLLISLVDKLHRFLPILAPRKMRWTEQEKNLDRIYRTGGLAFLIRKSVSSVDVT